MDFIKRHRYLLAFLLIAALHLVLRVRFLDHQLILDEGNNYLCLLTLGGRYPNLNFDQMLRFHPPLYLLSANFLSMLTGLRSPAFYETFSIALSTLTLAPLYLLGREVLNRRAGLLACLSYAVMPAAMAMDSWIKVDPMEVLFVVCYVCFLVKERSGWAGLSLGLAMLSKETAAFIVLGYLVYLVVARDRARVRPFIYSVLIGAALSAWWYLFLSLSRGRFLSFLLGTHSEVAMFDFGTLYYFRGLGADLGPFLILAALGGAAGALYGLFRGGRRLALLPLACSLTPYLFFLVLKGKPPWMVTTVLPFIALLCGQGMDAFLKLIRRQGRPIAAFAVCMLLVAGIVPALAVSYDDYMLSRQMTIYEFSRDTRQEAETIDAQLQPGEPLLAYFGAGAFPNSIFLSYLSDRPVVVVEENVTSYELSDILLLNEIDHAAIYNDSAGNSIALYMSVYEGFGFAWHAAIPFAYRDVTVDVPPVEVLPLHYYLFGIRGAGD